MTVTAHHRHDAEMISKESLGLLIRALSILLDISGTTLALGIGLSPHGQHWHRIQNGMCRRSRQELALEWLLSQSKNSVQARACAEAMVTHWLLIEGDPLGKGDGC